jgi:hypothetical protein
MTTLPNCHSLNDCLQHDGKRIQVTGMYRVWDPLPKRAIDHPPARQVMLIFSDNESGLYLGAWGYPDHFRDLEEIARFDGRRVSVTGTFLREMPASPRASEDAAALSGPCLHPVGAIDPG